MRKFFFWIVACIPLLSEAGGLCEAAERIRISVSILPKSYFV